MGNQLVECQECHNLYHQDCHKPQVTDKEVNDPRLVWYCARCTRQMKRMVRKINSSISFVFGFSELGLFLSKRFVFVFCPQGPETSTEAIPCVCIFSTCCKRHTSEKDGA